MFPSVGRTVHYVAYNGQHLAGIIIGVNPDQTVQLVTFSDMPNVAGENNFATSFMRNVRQDSDPKPGTWHAPERVEQ